MSGNCLNFVEKFCLSQQKTLEKWKLNFSRSALFQVKTRVSLKYFVTDCSSYYRYSKQFTFVALYLLVCL